MRATIPLMILLPCVLTSCEYELDPALVQQAEPAPTTLSPSRFNSAECGTLQGRVTWDGPIPVTETFIHGVPAEPGNFTIRTVANPNRPNIDEKTKAVAGAVVFLRGIDSSRARAWNHPPVRIEMKDGSIVVQGETKGRVGFVRRGELVGMISTEAAYHVIRARGDAFFSLAFPDPNREVSRRFDRTGLVELTSGAGYYWANAHIFVSDHPYFTRTDSEGRFQFQQVPAGRVEVVAWLPDWEVVKRERDPETGLYSRQSYGPPLEQSQCLDLKPQASLHADFMFSR